MKITKKGITMSSNTVRVRYGAFALFAAEVIYIGKGIKSDGIKGGLKNLGKLAIAEVALNAPAIGLTMAGKQDCKFMKGWNKITNLVGTEWNTNGFED